MKGKKWIISKKFHGNLTEDNLKLVEFDLPDELKEKGQNKLQSNDLGGIFI